VSAAALILAAGASTRLGTAKQLAYVGSERLVERAVRVAREAGCSPVLVVLGALAEEIQCACRLEDAQVAVHAGWKEGMAASLRVGVERLADAAAIMVMTCDQPAVTASHLRQLMRESEIFGGPVGSSYGAGRGVPACFPAACFGDLLRLRGESGARSLLAAAPAVELPGGELDVDTVESLGEAQRLYGGGAD
jgi:molybdenum cofactor cytidylyltransferase